MGAEEDAPPAQESVFDIREQIRRLAPRMDDIIVRNGKLYSLRVIDEEGIDVQDLLVRYAEAHMRDMTERFPDIFEEAIVADWRTKINHLESHMNRGRLCVPEELIEKSIAVVSGQVLETRYIIYAPNKLTTCHRYINGHHGRTGAQREVLCGHPMVKALFEATGGAPSTTAERERRFTIFFKPHFSMVVGYAFNPATNRMYTPHARTFHTMNDSCVCTGSAHANTYWQLQGEVFAETMNSVNEFSLGSKSAYSTLGGNEIGHPCHIGQLIKPENITDVRFNTRNSEGGWAV